MPILTPTIPLSYLLLIPIILLLVLASPFLYISKSCVRVALGAMYNNLKYFSGLPPDIMESQLCPPVLEQISKYSTEGHLLPADVLNDVSTNRLCGGQGPITFFK